MSATARGGDGAPTPAPSDAAETAYFRAIEDAFIRLRGAPLLLSPTDFQVASRWHREGIPLALVVATLDEVFAKRRERGAKGRINSLRYCAPAVEAAWAEVEELQGPARRGAAADVAVAERLAALAAALPADLDDRDAWVTRLARIAGDAEAVETALHQLDDELLARSAAALAPEARERLDAEVEGIVEGLRDRFPDTELAALRERLFRQRLRRLLGLPVLTLF
jgi:hypothetical protein